MPIRRKLSKKRKQTYVRSKRSGYRKRARTRGRSKVPRVIGFPSKYKTHLQLTDTLNITQGFAGVPQVYSYRLMSLFDPDFSGTGHQPKFFDQFANLYSNYKVHTAKIYVKFSTSQASNASAAPIIVALMPIDINDGISSWSNINAVCEEPRTKYREISAYGQAKPAQLSHSWSANRYFKDAFGRRFGEAAVNGTDVGSNPTNGEYLNIITSSIDSAATHPTIYAQVTIDFNCEFYDLKNQNQS